MKKSLISMLVIGLLVFGLVLVGCDNGTTDDPETKVIAQQFWGGRYELSNQFLEITDAGMLITNINQPGNSTLYVPHGQGSYTEGNDFYYNGIKWGTFDLSVTPQTFTHVTNTVFLRVN